MPSNDYYDHTTYPGPNAPGSSAALRAELDSIEQGFLKLPTLTGNGNKVVVINAGGTALTSTLSLSGLTLNSTTIGTTTPAAGAFTTLSASGAANLGSSVTISGGVINNTIIGGTTPVAGYFTTLNASGAITGNVTGNLTGNVTAGSGSSTFNNVTINGTLDMASATIGTISGLQSPSSSSDAANKGYVDTQRDTRLALAGGTMSGAIAMGNNAITGLPAPSSGGDATNKTYVDSILGSATAAATSASNAATSATNAANSATSAQTYAGDALTSANNAAASYDSFDDRYLGAKASDPTLDNDGNALLTGAIYWNTGSSIMKVWTGSTWSATYLPASGYLPLSGGTMTGDITFSGTQTFPGVLSLTGGTLTGNLTVNTGADSRVLLQSTGTTQGQFQSTASLVRLASNNALPLVLSTNGVDRQSIDDNGNFTFGSLTSSAKYTFQSQTTGDFLVLESVDASATAAPDLVLYRNSSSPAAADQIGIIIWRGKDSGAADQQYARIGVVVTDPTAGSEDGDIWFETTGNGAAAERFRFGSLGQFGIGGATYGTSGQALVSGGASAAPTWSDVVTPTGTQTLTNKTIRLLNSVISGNTTAVASTVYVLTASLTLTLPASPTAGDWVAFTNRSGTTTATIARNGLNIMGLAEDMTLDDAAARGTLVYADATRGWVLID